MGEQKNSRNNNILNSMDNNYLFILQNKYNELQNENNTLLRNELSVLDENRRAMIKMKNSKVIFLILFILFVLVSLIFVFQKTNLTLLGIANFLIPIVLLVVLVFVYKNVAYFKKHSNINVNDLNTIPRNLKPEEIHSSVSATPDEKCYTIAQSGPFQYIDPDDNKQIRDTLTTIGNINESLTKLNALKTHFREEDKLLPKFVSLLNSFLKHRANIMTKPDFDSVYNINDLDQMYNEYQVQANKALNEITLDLGKDIDAMYLSQNTPQGSGNWDGSVKFEDTQQDELTSDLVYGISISQYQKISGNKEQLARDFLDAQKLTNYFNAFMKWAHSQNDKVKEEYHNKLDSLQGSNRSNNTFKGHVGVPGS